MVCGVVQNTITASVTLIKTGASTYLCSCNALLLILTYIGSQGTRRVAITDGDLNKMPDVFYARWYYAPPATTAIRHTSGRGRGKMDGGSVGLRGRGGCT